jgi:hypothetical protein
MSERGLNSNLSPKLFWALFGTLSIFTVLPFWAFRYPVLTDFPQHLARWFVLYRIHDPVFRFSSYYTADWGPHPYVLVDILGVWFQHILSIDITGRCVASICVLSVPLATLFFLRKAAPGNDSLALLGFLIALNPPLLMGFLENELSLGLCVFVVGLWVSYCEFPKLRIGLMIVVGILLVYLTHLIGFALLGLVTGFYCLTLKRPLRRLVELGFFSLPALALFTFNMRRLLGGGDVYYMAAWDKLRNLVYPFRIYSRSVDLIILAGLAASLFLLYRNRKEIQWQKAWIIVCILLLIVYLAAPGEYGLAGYIDVRIMPLVWVLALALVRIRTMPRTLTALIALIVLFRCGTVAMLFASKQHSLEERTLAFQAIPSGTRVLPLVTFGSEESLIGNASLHHIAYGVISRGFFLPSIAWLPGLQPLRVTGARYCPDVTCEVVTLEDTDWGQVASNYDYLWVDTHPSAVPYVESIADRVFSSGTVFVYRVRKPSSLSH